MLGLTTTSDQLMDGFEQIRDTIGPEAQSGIPDQEIKDTLYYYHYDVGQSLDYILRESTATLCAVSS